MEKEDNGPVGDYAPEGAMCEKRPRIIPFSRRKELLRLAVETAENLQPRVAQHERCLFRNMVESLLER